MFSLYKFIVIYHKNSFHYLSVIAVVFFDTKLQKTDICIDFDQFYTNSIPVTF